MLTWAQDADLCVAEVGGAPEAKPESWEGPAYAQKNALLIRLLQGKEGPARACRYACVVVLRNPDGRTWHVRGEVRGQIAFAPAGSGGVGPGPNFFLPPPGPTPRGGTGGQEAQSTP